MGLSVLGVGSGIDLATTLEQLETSERARLTPITNQQKIINAKISAYGKLKSSLVAFNTATEKLQNVDLYSAKSVKGSDSYFSATAGSDAVLGDYSIKIDQLATSHSVASGVKNDQKTPLGSDDESRTVTITQANGDSLDVNLSKDETSLEGMANAINNAKIVNEDGSTSPSTMNATVVRSGSGSYQLVVTSKETGEEQTITSIKSSDETLNKVIDFDSADTENSAMTEVTHAQDAQFSLNGINITSGSNTIKDVVTGVDITLKAKTPTAEKLSVESNTEEAMTAIKAWVDAYNELQSTMSSLTQFTIGDTNSDALDSNNGPLVGDSTLRNIDQSLRSTFSRGQPGEYSVLSDIGITMDNSGKLSIKEEKLEKALNENSTAVATLFTGDGETTGIANQVFTSVSGFIDSDGPIDTATNGLNSTLKTLDKRYEQVENSIEQTLERYRTQFTNLDVLINSLDNISSYLTTQFEAMKNSK